jgi:hypothetical protein
MNKPQESHLIYLPIEIQHHNHLQASGVRGENLRRAQIHVILSPSSPRTKLDSQD